MARLSYAERKALPDKDFIFPAKRKYPIPDKSHAKNARSRAAQNLSGAAKKKVFSKTKKKFPGLSSYKQYKKGE